MLPEGASSVGGNFTKMGSGDTVFELPARSIRIRIQGTYQGTSTNFIVGVAGLNVVNEIIGTGRSPQSFDGTYDFPNGGKVEITNSSGVAWEFTEVR